MPAGEVNNDGNFIYTLAVNHLIIHLSSRLFTKCNNQAMMTHTHTHNQATMTLTHTTSQKNTHINIIWKAHMLCFSIGDSVFLSFPHKPGVDRNSIFFSPIRLADFTSHSPIIKCHLPCFFTQYVLFDVMFM